MPPLNVTVSVPYPGATIDQDLLRELRKRGVLPSDITAFHAIDGFAAAFGGSLPYVPADSNAEKRWADTGKPTEYITINGFLDTSNPATWSDFTMTVVGLTIANFWRERVTAKDPLFARIPRLVKYTVAEPRGMNMTADVGRIPGPRQVSITEVPYPLAKLQDDPSGDNGKRWSWPPNHALRFNPTTGLPEVFDYQEYGKAYPITTTVSVGGGGTGTIRVKGMSDEGFLSVAAGAIFGVGTPADRVAKIIGNLEVK